MRKSAQTATYDLTQSAVEDLLMVIGESRQQVAVYSAAIAHITNTRKLAKVSVDRARARLRDAERDLEAEQGELETIGGAEALLHREFAGYLRLLGHSETEAHSLCQRLGFEHARPILSGEGELAAAVASVRQRKARAS